MQADVSRYCQRAQSCKLFQSRNLAPLEFQHPLSLKDVKNSEFLAFAVYG